MEQRMPYRENGEWGAASVGSRVRYAKANAPFPLSLTSLRSKDTEIQTVVSRQAKAMSFHFYPATVLFIPGLKAPCSQATCL